ncbi:PLD nuclease N-terminal domain-containing protein [Psychrobacillus lasiicapitis]|uniref:PLDc_N domain-containing protein n=1 Tax=Psychrobacillus lasiicapitis TaxID=1636719 RepID=A0A544T4S1_9BACI|nr:PLD nuclease N-terminal domain-containing protein [Psychrobacillus lasiicapitis]TQR12452.1 PLDc_N domain-containing protein [Psychrobacillus lasiicapitis]GGA38231.1 phosphatidylserine synthase [Psychrobacillus lasiicapitis]
MQLHYGLEELEDLDWMGIMPIILPFLAIGFILILIAWIDLFRNRKTRKNVLMWALIIFFLNTIGPILYFALGRKDEAER